jgi:hypothetical protein
MPSFSFKPSLPRSTEFNRLLSLATKRACATFHADRSFRVFLTNQKLKFANWQQLMLKSGVKVMGNNFSCSEDVYDSY